MIIRLSAFPLQMGCFRYLGHLTAPIVLLKKELIVCRFNDLKLHFFLGQLLFQTFNLLPAKGGIY